MLQATLAWISQAGIVRSPGLAVLVIQSKVSVCAVRATGSETPRRSRFVPADRFALIPAMRTLR